MPTPFLGNIATSFTNGLLGTDYPAGTNHTLTQAGSVARRGFLSFPGIDATFNRDWDYYSPGDTLSDGLAKSADFGATAAKSMITDPYGVLIYGLKPSESGDPIQGFLMTNKQIRPKDEFRNPSKLEEVSEMIQAGRQNSG